MADETEGGGGDGSGGDGGGGEGGEEGGQAITTMAARRRICAVWPSEFETRRRLRNRRPKYFVKLEERVDRSHLSTVQL